MLIDHLMKHFLLTTAFIIGCSEVLNPPHNFDPNGDLIFVASEVKSGFYIQPINFSMKDRSTFYFGYDETELHIEVIEETPDGHRLDFITIHPDGSKTSIRKVVPRKKVSHFDPFIGLDTKIYYGHSDEAP